MLTLVHISQQHISTPHHLNTTPSQHHTISTPQHHLNTSTPQHLNITT
ncbi:hypothetical protein [Leyella stercorea]